MSRPTTVRSHGARKPLSAMPRWLRPRLKADQVQDLSIAHHGNLDTIYRGEADGNILLQWAGGIYTWSTVAKRLGMGEPEMQVQLDLAKRVLDRFTRTGAATFEGDDYRLATDGVVVMDLLAATTDAVTALQAAVEGERLMHASVKTGAEVVA